ncbi:unnamed protein product [Ectocarpus sp. CCAP 1310/34]|nr:unnamed protein product [Ectocarpus sp. CCAP 1310/34]
MRPVNPPAKYKGGSFPYACKITDDCTKMKEVYLLHKKSDTTEAVHTYNMCVAEAGGYRIETIRCDKGSENTGSEFRDYCKNSAIKLEYAATNTPQQIGVSERDGHHGLHSLCKEMDNLRKHNVCNLVPLSSVPKGEKILGTKFVFKKKLDGRFKARLGVGGHRQGPGQDYGRSYAPVCRIGSIRMTCAVGCHNNWPIYQLDVVSAFLNALCDRDVYVRPAPGTSAKNFAKG